MRQGALSRGNLSYQLNPGIDGVEEGEGRVDELADGRGRGAGDEPEDLLRAGPSHRGPRDPRRPPGDRIPRLALPRGLAGVGSGADEQAAPPPCAWLRREREAAGIGRGGLGCEERERERQRVERAEVDGGRHRILRSGQPAPRVRGRGKG